MSDKTVVKRFNTMIVYRSFGDFHEDDIKQHVSKELTMPLDFFEGVEVYSVTPISKATHGMLIYDYTTDKKHATASITFECSVGMFFNRVEYNRFKVKHPDLYGELEKFIDELVNDYIRHTNTANLHLTTELAVVR